MQCCEVALQAAGGWIREKTVGARNEGGCIDGTFQGVRGPTAFSGPLQGIRLLVEGGKVGFLV